MKKKHAYASRETEPVESGRVLENITRFWVTLLVIALILYIAVYAISRSEGFRDIVQQRLSLMTGTPLVIEQSRADVWMNLILTGVSDSTNAIAQSPGISIGYARLKWRWIPLLRGEGWPFDHLHIKDATIRFSQTTNGVWRPFPMLHDAIKPLLTLDADSTQATPASITEVMRMAAMDIYLENITLIWRPPFPDEPPLAVVEMAYLKTAPLEPFGDPVLWFKMRLGRVESDQVEWLRDVDMEWIRRPDQDVVLHRTGTIVSDEQRRWQRDLLLERE
jgi:hypothetical protein